MKKLISVLLILVMVLGLAACGSSDKKDETEAAKNDATTAAAEEQEEEKTTAAETQEDVVGGDGEALHEIYQIENRQALQGLISPKRLVNRSGIDKCLPTELKDDVFVGITVALYSSSWFVDCEKGATDYFDTVGYTYTALCHETDVAESLSQLDGFIAQGVDEVIAYIWADNIPNFAEVCVKDNKTPLITLSVADDPYVPVITCVAAGEFEMGWKVGCYVGEHLINEVWEEGEVITSTMLYGETGTTVSDSKNCGMIAGMIYGSRTARGEEWIEEDAMLAGYNYIQEIIANGKCFVKEINLDIVGVASGIGATTDSALPGAEDMVTLAPDQDMMFANNDFIAMAGVIALQQAGKEIGKDVYVWACSDASAPACEYLKTGELYCTGVNSSYGMSKGAGVLTHMIFSEGYDASDMPIHTLVPAAVVTKDNVEQFFTLGRDMADPPDAIFQTTAEALAEYGLTEGPYVGP